jgi:hypothetical protein
MKKWSIGILLVLAAHTQAADPLRVEGGAQGICLKGFISNEPGKVCMKAGENFINKPIPPGGCIAPWVASNGRCVAVLKVGKKK